jgi:hypothetical protein
MDAQLPCRCAIALFASMILALLIGLLAWGPIVAPQASQAPGASAALLLDGASLLVSFAMVCAGLWGLRQLEGHPQPAAWALFFVAIALAGPAAAYHHWAPDGWSLFVTHLLAGWASTALVCACLAERVDTRWSRAPLLLGSLTLAALAVSHWAVGEVTHGAGDMRSHLLLQSLPLLLVPAGLVQLPGRWTTPRDWYVVLSLHAAALLVDALGATSLQYLPWAGAAGWLGWRLAAPGRHGSAEEPGAASEASTSLNTSA